MKNEKALFETGLDYLKRRADATVTDIVTDVASEAEKDDHLQTPKSQRWYFVTPEQHKAIIRANVSGVGDPSLIKIFDYDLIVVADSRKTGRQRNAFELVSVIDTYPSYPRVLPR